MTQAPETAPRLTPNTEFGGKGSKGADWMANHRLADEATLQAIKTALENGAVLLAPVHQLGPIPIPGIATASVYTAADAFGTTIIFDPVPKAGTISNVLFLDLDDEGIDKELVLFSQVFTETADHDAFAVSDGDLNACVGIVAIDVFFDFSANQLGVATPALSYLAPEGKFYAQLVTRGTDNIAAGAIPKISLVIV